MKKAPEETTITTELDKIRMRCADLLKEDDELDLNDLQLADGGDPQLPRIKGGVDPYNRVR